MSLHVVPASGTDSIRSAGRGVQRFASNSIYPRGPRNCAVSLSIAPATSRHCASQLLGKRNVRSAPSMRRSLRHMPGVAASRVQRATMARRAGEEQVFAAVGRAVAERAQGQAVLARRRSLLEIARIDGADADVRRQRVMMRRDRQEDAVDRLHGVLGRLGAGVLRRAPPHRARDRRRRDRRAPAARNGAGPSCAPPGSAR